MKYQSDKFPKYIKKSFELEKIRVKQDMPFDLFTDVFLKNREEIIAYKMQQILENDAEKILEENYNLAKKQSFKNNNRIFRMLERDIDRFKIEDLKLIFKYYNIEDIVRVFLFYINNIAQNRSGFPDLMIFNENELKFIEVKGPNDTIKEHQIEKIMLLNQNNIKSEILTINHTERKLNNLTKKIKENSESIIVKYPESLPTFLKKSEKHNLNSYLEYGENNAINILAFIIVITFIIAFFPFYILYLIFKKKR
nr:MAG TPA: VRR-NUC domain protein [Caudoviricetes sp.]